MKKLAFALFALVLVLSIPALAAPNASKQHAEAKIGSDVYTIEGVSQWITSPGTYDRLRIEYKIRKNGTMMFPTNSIGGTLLSCAYGNIEKAELLPKQFIKPIEVEGKFEGWMVHGLGICGNTTSEKFHVILLRSLSGSYPKPLYAVEEFIAKTTPKFKKVGDTIEIWTVYQEWGKGGTAGSFFVPKKYKFKVNDRYSPRIESDGVGAKIEEWPDFEKDDVPVRYYPSIFAAGIRENNPELIRIAAEKYFKDDKDSLTIYEWIGVPTSKSEAKKVADALSATKGYLDTFRSR
jgi:hypothetical protein